MPVELIKKGPKEVVYNCPNCESSHAVLEGSNRRVRCSRCRVELSLDFKDGLKVSIVGDRHLKQVEKCPNDECGKSWECWFNHQGSLVKISGAQRTATDKVVCSNCRTIARVIYNKNID